MAIPTAKKYILDFERLGFGMFVHWGLYAQQARGECTYFLHNQTMDEYKKLFDTFTAENFDAEDMVLMAKNAGCKYITLTTKHQEGFSLFDTCGLCDFDAPHSPAKRDLVREFADACNKHGIIPFFYYSTLDYYQKSFEENFDEYLEYQRKCVEVLCKNYGKVGGFWFDGNWSKPDADWKEDELYGTIRKYQPEAMIINNTGLGARGEVGHPEIDSVTFEQGRPFPMNREGHKKYIAAEMCYTLNEHWGIASLDFNYKSPGELIRALCDCRKVGANLLLNIGPRAQGGIEPIQRNLFEIIGRWMNLYGEAIYEGKPYKSYGLGENFVLEGEDCLYLFFPELGGRLDEHIAVPTDLYFGAYSFDNITKDIESVCWLDNNEELDFCQHGKMFTVNATGFSYGMRACVRVAKAKIKKG